MSQKALSNWLKTIIILMAICGMIIFIYVFPFLIVPIIIKQISNTTVDAFSLWTTILSINAIPCYIVLFFGWKIANNIGKDKSFTVKNSKYLEYIMITALLDSIFFLIANIVMLHIKMSTGLIFVIAIIMIFAGIVIAITAACLSHLVLKAAKLQEQNDLTI